MSREIVCCSNCRKEAEEELRELVRKRRLRPGPGEQELSEVGARR